jgi:hypothetical protein
VNFLGTPVADSVEFCSFFFDMKMLDTQNGLPLPLAKVSRNGDGPSARLTATPMSAAILYFLTILITCLVTIGMMSAIASDSNYEPDPDVCSCDCFDRRFKGEHFNATDEYRQVQVMIEFEQFVDEEE